MLQICDRYLSYNCDRYLPHKCDRYVMGPNSYTLQICDRYLSYNCNRYLSHNCDRYLSHNCNRYLSNICDRYVMGPNSYMLQICDRYFRTYILQVFYRTVTYICHISVSLVREAIFTGLQHSYVLNQHYKIYFCLWRISASSNIDQGSVVQSWVSLTLG
jgi:hypothetical protein